MDTEEVYELLRLLKKLHEVPELYCPLKDQVRKLSNAILKHAGEIVEQR